MIDHAAGRSPRWPESITLWEVYPRAKDRMFAHEVEQGVLLAAIRSFGVSVWP